MAKRSHLLTRRALVLGAGAGVAGLVLLARLYHLQFLQQERYRTLAEGNRIKLHLTPPSRGILLDRNGTPLAKNEQNYRLLLRSSETSNLASSVEEISKLIHLNYETVTHILTNYKPRKYAPPILLKEFLEWEEVAALEYHSASIPGLVIEVGEVRYYPYGEAMAHVLGYMGAVSEQDLDDRELLRLPDFKIGRDGMEKTQEDRLQGTPGIKEVEVNVHGLVLRELNTQRPISGEDVPTTLDAELQAYTHKLMGRESAACVVMDVVTGDILSLVSTPAFDPNRFSKGITHSYWRELNENKKVPLLNKATAGQYPPGSTFKMLVGMAGLHHKEVTTGERIFCPGHFVLGGHRFNCWKAGGHGWMDLHHAIAESCDTYFYTLGVRLGIEAIGEMATAYGMGQSYDLPLLSERSGLVPSPQWKRKSYDQPWQGGDTVNASIGQGYVLATPLQMAVMTARIASGGRAVRPRLLLDKSTPEFEPITLTTPEQLAATRQAMAAVTNQRYGTAYWQRITEPQYAMAGKTGTAQVRRILQRGQDQSTLPWEFRHHAWFVAYAPVDQPRYACAVLVEHGGSGGSAAGPVARDILLKAQQTEATRSQLRTPIKEPG